MTELRLIFPAKDEETSLGSELIDARIRYTILVQCPSDFGDRAFCSDHSVAKSSAGMASVLAFDRRHA